MRLASFLFVLTFCYIYFSQNHHKSDLKNNRSISSVKSLKNEKLKNKIRDLGLDNVFNIHEFQKFLQNENLNQVTLEGELIAEYQDFDFSHQHEKLVFYLKDQYNDLEKVDILNEDIHEFVGKSVELRGIENQGLPTGFIIPKATKSAKTTSATIKPVREVIYKEYNMLVLLFKFNNSPQVFTTADEIHQTAFNGAFNKFFNDMSDGRIIHKGQVYGFYHLNRNGDDDNGSDMPCDVSWTEVKQAIAYYNIDVKKFDTITTVSNCTEYFTIGGRAILSPYDFLNIGHPMEYIKMASKPDMLSVNGQHPHVPGWNAFNSILIHERGHNFNLFHSNALDCDDSLVLFPCENIEYGNKFDRMGGPDGSFLFNANQQLLAGWKRDVDFLHIKSNGVFKIDEITSRKKNRKIGAYIYNPKNLNQKLFMLEYRTPKGMDKNLEASIFKDVKDGALLYTALGASSEINSPNVGTTFRIIDAQPTSLGWHQDTAYESLQGEYVDIRSGVKINVYAPYNDSIEFQVSMNPQDSVCGLSTLKDWSSNPYIKLYYNLKPVPHSQTKSSRPGGGVSTGNTDGGNGTTTVITMNDLNLPKFSKEVKKQHLVLVPGDYYHLKIDTLIGEHMICDRTNMEVQILNPQDLQTHFILSNTTINSFKKSTKNINQKVEFPILRVPTVDLNKDKIIHYQIKNKVTGEVIKKKLYLHIRSSHDVIIPISHYVEK